jgi:Histidine kinase/Histidine kinase-, DNA gyrase B-, and HSP90-like ATPase
MTDTRTASQRWLARWQSLSAAGVRAFHVYANWLVSISWRKFVVLSVLLIILANVLQTLPPFSWRITETVDYIGGDAPKVKEPKPPKPPKPQKEPKEPKQPTTATEPSIRIERMGPGASHPQGVDITVDSRGIRIMPRAAPAAAASPASAALPADAESAGTSVAINLPEGSTKEEVREAIRGAIQDAKGAIQDAVQAQRDALEAAREAQAEAEQAARGAKEEAEQALHEAAREARSITQRTRRIHWGEFLGDLSLLWVLGSLIIKVTYKGRVQAEVKAAQAAETAESESLKRQVVEARMAAMQAQVEPHFLFNTLASIDHLIETDPARASIMQKNLIALLRASMPTMREASDGSARDLGRELAVIRPYLEILKVRMEERLATTIDVPEGLHSAEFPTMMIQTLVENAIKHGLEPKAEGGSLAVKAEILHGKLAVSVADTGLGFGRAATAGTGVGLANIRERLQLLYGTRASLTVAENSPSGTRVTITVPYKTLEGAAA